MSLGLDSLLLGFNETLGMTPASAVKLLTTACALGRWNDSLVAGLESRLRRSKLRNHRRLLDPAGAESLGVEAHPGLPGHRYLVWTNHQSDNRMADWMLELTCRENGSSPGRQLADLLDSMSVARPGLVLLDGSGLSHDNRVAPLTLAALLTRMRASDRKDFFWLSLPSPGSRSTLKERGLGLGARIRAKTGYIKGVFALSGYLSAETDTFAFAFILNGCPNARAAYRLFVRLLLDLYHWNARRPRRLASQR